MTLLIGIYCADGIVIAGDRMATRGSIDQPTVGSPLCKVNTIKGGRGLFAFSGYTGLGQIIQANVDQYLDTTKTYAEAVVAIQPRIRNIIAQAMQMAQIASGHLPGASGECICKSLVAAHFSDGLKLLELTEQGAFDVINEIGWTCIGGGQANADPFMHFLWNVYWNDRVPNCSEGALTASWALSTVIDAGTSGVGFNTDISVLQHNGSHHEARKLTDDELAYNAEFAKDAVSAMREHRSSMFRTDDADPANERLDPLPPPPTTTA